MIEIISGMIQLPAELDRDSAGAVYASRGVIKAVLGQNLEAIADFDKAIELDPDYAYAYFFRGRARRSTGHANQAESDKRTAYRLAGRTTGKDPMLPRCYFTL